MKQIKFPRINEAYNPTDIYKYKNAKNLFDKTITMWRQAFKKMSDEELQVFMKEIANFSKDYRQ